MTDEVRVRPSDSPDTSPTGVPVVGDPHELVFQEMMDEVVLYLKEKGWWDDGRSVGDDMALLHSEVSEALEEFRDGRMKTRFQYIDRGRKVMSDSPTNADGYPGKPIGFPSEIGGLFIRILDVCARHDINLVQEFRWGMRYNMMREHRHGGRAI